MLSVVSLFCLLCMYVYRLIISLLILVGSAIYVIHTYCTIRSPSFWPVRCFDLVFLQFLSYKIVILRIRNTHSWCVSNMLKSNDTYFSQPPLAIDEALQSYKIFDSKMILFMPANHSITNRLSPKSMSTV